MNTIDRVIALLEDLVIYLDKYDAKFLKELGDAFSSKKFRKIAFSLNNNENIFNEIRKVKIDKKEKKERFQKSFYRLELPAKLLYYFIYTVLAIVTLILHYFTYVSGS
jgi:hypothetical protein